MLSNPRIEGEKDMTTAYVTESEVGRILGTSFSGSTTPTATGVTALIESSDRFIEQYTHRKWGSSGSVIEFQNGTNRPRIYTNHPDIIRVWRVYEDTTGVGGSANWTRRYQGRGNDFIVYSEASCVDTSSSAVETGDNGYLYFHTNVPDTSKLNVKIVYEYGQPSTPQDIRDASALLTIMKVVRAKIFAGETGFLDEFAIGDAKYKYGKGGYGSVSTLMKEVMLILDARKKEWVFGMG